VPAMVTTTSSRWHRKVNREVGDFCDQRGMSKIARDPLYRRHRFPAEVIAQAVWLYFRFPRAP